MAASRSCTLRTQTHKCGHQRVRTAGRWQPGSWRNDEAPPSPYRSPWSAPRRCRLDTRADGYRPRHRRSRQWDLNRLRLRSSRSARPPLAGNHTMLSRFLMMIALDAPAQHRSRKSPSEGKVGARWPSLDCLARLPPLALQVHREWLYRRTATAPMNGSEMALTGAEVDPWRVLRTATAPVKLPDGTATEPRLCFSHRYSTDGVCSTFS